MWALERLLSTSLYIAQSGLKKNLRDSLVKWEDQKKRCSMVPYSCVGFVWQGFGSGGVTGVASARSYQNLPLCLTEPMPAGSKTDPPLAISDNGGASGRIDLRKRENSCRRHRNGSRREE